METLYAVAAWFREHWAGLAVVVAAIAVVAVIAMLPHDARRWVLVFLAVALLAVAAVVLWATRPWESSHYSLVAFYLVAGVPALLAVLAAAWAWIAW